MWSGGYPADPRDPHSNPWSQQVSDTGRPVEEVLLAAAPGLRQVRPWACVRLQMRAGVCFLLLTLGHGFRRLCPLTCPGEQQGSVRKLGHAVPCPTRSRPTPSTSPPSETAREGEGRTGETEARAPRSSPCRARVSSPSLVVWARGLFLPRTWTRLLPFPSLGVLVALGLCVPSVESPQTLVWKQTQPAGPEGLEAAAPVDEACSRPSWLLSDCSLPRC